MAEKEGTPGNPVRKYKGRPLKKVPLKRSGPSGRSSSAKPKRKKKS